MQPERSPARCLWAFPITRIYEAFALVCPLCGGPMRAGHEAARCTGRKRVRVLVVDLDDRTGDAAADTETE